MRKLPENIRSKYFFITLAAKRCQMLLNGASPKTVVPNATKMTTVAMEEILDGLIDFEIVDTPVEEEKAPVEVVEEEQGSTTIGLL